MTTGEWTKDEIEYAKANRFENSYREIGKVLGRTRNAVMIKLNRLGLRLPEKYTFDKDFFEKIDSEEKAYWLGFIYADGYISNETEFAIHLKQEDEKHLEKLNKALRGNMQVKEFIKHLNVTDKDYKMCSLRVYSKKIVQDLKNKGVTRNKSLSIEFPKLRKPLIRHFIRGFFDGDGSIYLHKEKNHIRCKFTCASKIFVSELNNILNSLKIRTYIINESKTNKSKQLGITGKDSTKIFLEYIYDNSEIYLDRKYKFYYNNKNLLSYSYEGWNKK